MWLIVMVSNVTRMPVSQVEVLASYSTLLFWTGRATPQLCPFHADSSLLLLVCYRALTISDFHYTIIVCISTVYFNQIDIPVNVVLNVASVKTFFLTAKKNLPSEI